MCCFALGFYCSVCVCIVCRMCYFCSRMFEDSKFYCCYYYFYSRVQLLLFRLVCCFLLCKVECCFLLCVLVSVVFYCVQTSVCGSGDYRLPPLGIWSRAWEWINPWRSCSQTNYWFFTARADEKTQGIDTPERKETQKTRSICVLETVPSPFPPREQHQGGFIQEKPEPGGQRSNSGSNS